MLTLYVSTWPIYKIYWNKIIELSDATKEIDKGKTLTTQKQGKHLLKVTTKDKRIFWSDILTTLTHRKLTVYITSQLTSFYMMGTSVLTNPAPCIWKSCIEIKININLYFHNSLWFLKRFYEGLIKPFWGTTKESENKNFR